MRMLISTGFINFGKVIRADPIRAAKRYSRLVVLRMSRFKVAEVSLKRRIHCKVKG